MSKSEFLRAAAKIEGVYVPSLYEPEYNPDGTLAAVKVSDGNEGTLPDGSVVFYGATLKAAQGALINVSMLYCSSQINTFGLVSAATNNIGNKIARFSNIITIQ